MRHWHVRHLPRPRSLDVDILRIPVALAALGGCGRAGATAAAERLAAILRAIGAIALGMPPVAV